MDGALYSARIAHRRLVAPLYRFQYRAFYLLLDIDRIDAAAAGTRFFSHNRFNLMAFHDCDHGHGHGPTAVGAANPLRHWVEGVIRPFGVELEGGRVRLLTLPRLLGFVFNPVSFWYCEHRDGTLRAIVAEVNNTFGERHSYVLASAGGPLAYDALPTKRKRFHVSPFMDVAGQYDFELSPPEDKLRVVIRQSQDGQPRMIATLAAERRPLTNGVILRQLLAMPLMTLKVVAAINWQGLKLWLRGAGFRSKPQPPSSETS